MGNGVGVDVGSAAILGVGEMVGVGVGWTVGRGVAVATSDFPAGDGLGTGPVTTVEVGNGVGVAVARTVGVCLPGTVGITVLVGEGSGVEGPGVS